MTPNLFRIAFVIAAVAFAKTAFAAPELEHKCKQMVQPLPYSYCITKTPMSKNSDVLYFLHGGGGTADQWMTSPRAIELRALWIAEKLDAPTVIEISFGPFWFVFPQERSLGSGLLELVADELMPELETEAGVAAGSRRQLLGVSMGGLNSASLRFSVRRFSLTS